MPLQDANPTPSFGGFGLTTKEINVAVSGIDFAHGDPSRFGRVE